MIVGFLLFQNYTGFEIVRLKEQNLFNLNDQMDCMNVPTRLTVNWLGNM